VDLQVVIEAARPVSQGNLLLMRDTDKQLGPDAEALVLAVGGDTLFGIAAQVANHTIGRPMALDLMWQARLLPQEPQSLLHCIDSYQQSRCAVLKGSMHAGPVVHACS
jgi:hypothetical protein